MKRTVFLLVAVTSILQGCSWTGELSKDFYVPESRAASEKADITLGLLDRKPPKDVRYGMSVDYRLSLNNYIYALRSELAQHFQNVRIVKNEDECPECKLFVEPRVSVKLQQMHQTYDAYLDCDFIFRNGKSLTQLSTRSEGNISTSAELKAQTVINGAMMGLLAGPTINAYGDMITDVSQNALSEVISLMGRKIRKDPFLEPNAIASIVENYPEANPNADGSVPKDNSKLGASKYQRYIDATFTVFVPNGTGSGFAVSEKGLIITNAHVVENWAAVQVAFSDGHKAAGTVLKVDKRRDLALIKIIENTPKYLTLGHEKDFSVGEKVLAIGAPSSLSNTVTAGIISQSRNSPRGRQIQTDANINQGNSGGPLISEKTGTVVGVNAWAIVRNLDGTHVSGLNFAVSVDEVRDFLGMK